MKAIFVIISFTLLLFFLQTSAEETKDASISREVRAADAGKKESRSKKGKKKCKGKKCRKKLKTKERNKGNGKNESRINKGKKKCKGKKCNKKLRTKERKKGKGKNESRVKKRKKNCKGKKCQKKVRTKDRKKGKEDKKPKCKKGKNCRKGKKGRKAKGGKGKRGRSGKERKEKGKKGGNGEKGRKKKGRKRKNGKGGKGKKGRRFRNSGRNGTVPAKCTASTCTNTDYVNLFNDYKKNDNMLRQLQRLVRFYDLIKKKAASALTSFGAAAKAIGKATKDCSTCIDASLKTSAVGNCTLLKKCSVTAPAICTTTGITYDKIKKQCPSGNTCPAGSNGVSITNVQCGTGCPPPPFPGGPPDCSNVCEISQGKEPALTEADKTSAEKDCIPVLKSWNKQYRDCNAGDTFGCQQSGCNDLKGECNLKNCKCKIPDRTCDFEECVKDKKADGSDYKDFVCNTCLKNLKAKLAIPAKCAKIAKYERAVFARKEECTRKEKTGSFGDCVGSQKAIIPMIIPCLGGCTGSTSCTTMAPTGRLLALKNQNMFQYKKRT